MSNWVNGYFPLRIKVTDHLADRADYILNTVFGLMAVLALLSVGTLLSLLSFAPPAMAEWHTPLRLDSSNGNHANPAYSPSGDLWVFYTVNDDSTEKLVRRIRTQGAENFDEEALVYDMAGRAVQPLFTTAGDIRLAVQDRNDLRLLNSIDNGSTWSLERYWIATDSLSCTGYLPSFLTVNEEGYHLIFGFTHKNAVTGCVKKIYFMEKSSGSWMPPAMNLGTAGRIHKVFEQGNDIIIVEERGVWRSNDKGASFASDSELRHSTGATQDEEGTLYLIRSFYYGLPPNDYHLEIHRSSDFGLSWSLLRQIDAGAYYIRPKIAVTNGTIVVVWASTLPGSGTLNQIHYIMSPNSGETWSEPEAIVTYNSGYATTSTENPFALVANSDVVTLSYSLGDSYNPLGVYMMEWYGNEIPPQITPKPIATPLPSNPKNLTAAAKKVVKRLPRKRRTAQRKEAVATLKIFLGKIAAARQGEDLTLRQKERAGKASRAIRKLIKAKTQFKLRKRRALQKLSRFQKILPTDE